ncbi:MAG TPA: site-2 protease family protein [Longimicrobiaceae bacterium]|nr:site-2 protease family protein [Longimicrobiaceae bacterium]
MENLDNLLLYLPVLLLSFTAHEFAHAWVALKQGDDTAYMLGRVTLNPAAHIDPIGSILFPAIGALTGAPVLGWAKPVPTNSRKYRNYRRGDILVSLAGVAANFVLVLLFTLLCVGILLVMDAVPAGRDTLGLLWQMLVRGILLNVGLILFNLIPIPPLDGSHVLYHYLPPRLGAQYRQLYPYGMFILWGLVLLGGFNFLGPAIFGVASVFLRVAGAAV